MIANRPSIFIYNNRGDEKCIREICAGIEEEGVFFEIFHKDVADADALAFDAANESMMGSGIGIARERIVLQMKGIPRGKNVQSFAKPTLSQCRQIGANSARIIKKMALKQDI